MAEEPYAQVVDDLEDDLLYEMGCPKKMLRWLVVCIGICALVFFIWILCFYLLQ
jgi:hypothetical protein